MLQQKAILQKDGLKLAVTGSTENGTTSDDNIRTDSNKPKGTTTLVVREVSTIYMLNNVHDF